MCKNIVNCEYNTLIFKYTQVNNSIIELELMEINEISDIKIKSL